jgi:cellulose biosynthesis protein BcsQ
MARTRGQVITMAHTKGGVGKSTLAGTLVWVLAIQTRHPGLRRLEEHL